MVRYKPNAKLVTYLYHFYDKTREKYAKRKLVWNKTLEYKFRKKFLKYSKMILFLKRDNFGDVDWLFSGGKGGRGNVGLRWHCEN